MWRDFKVNGTGIRIGLKKGSQKERTWKNSKVWNREKYDNTRYDRIS